MISRVREADARARAAQTAVFLLAAEWAPRLLSVLRIVAASMVVLSHAFLLPDGSGPFWEAVLEKAGIELGKTYPKPIVDHGRAIVMDNYDLLSVGGNERAAELSGVPHTRAWLMIRLWI